MWNLFWDIRDIEKNIFAVVSPKNLETNCVLVGKVVTMFLENIELFLFYPICR